MQRDTTGEFMSENSKYTVLNGYSETKIGVSLFRYVVKCVLGI